MRHLVLALAILAGCSSKEEPTLHVLTWEDYFAKDTEKNFEKEFGCHVKVDFIKDAEDYRTKLAGGKSGFDVVVPSDDVVADLVDRGLLEKLDLPKIPNLKNIAAKHRGLPFDPKNEVSVPYQWGTTGIAWNMDEIKTPPDSWAALWDPRNAGHAVLLGDTREVFAAAMRLDGADPNGTTRDSIAKARKRFEGWKPLAYVSSPKDMLVNGDAWIAQAYSGDAIQAAEGARGKKRIGFVIPKEGGTLWLDNLAIAKGAPNPDLAHKFIDYLLRPEVSAAITNERYFGSPNEPALKLIQKEVLDNKMAYPAEADLKRLSMLPVLSPEVRKALNDAWASIRGK
jgi:spermidine/putrescine transport system substrate-binding protein